MSTNIKLPKDWKWTKLGETCEIVSGNTPKGLEEISNTGECHFYKVSDMNSIGNEIKMNVSNFNLTTEEIKKLKLKIYPRGTVIFPKRGGAILTNKKRLLSKDASFDLNLMGILPNEKVESSYLFYWMQKLDLGKIYDGSNVPQINNKNVAPLDFPLPPLSTQQAIVSKIEELFSELDNGITNLKTAQQQLKTYRQSVLKWAFEGKLTNKKVKEGELPKGWKNVELKEVVTLSAQKHKPTTSENLFYVGLEHIEKHTGNLTSTVGVEKITTIKNKFNKDDILYGKLRPNLNKCYLAKVEGVCSTDILVLKLSQECLGKYLHPIMVSTAFVNEMSENTSGVNLPRVPTKFILEYKIPLPPIEEQHRIINELESRLSVADKMEESINQSLQQAEALRQSILKKAFEGKLV